MGSADALSRRLKRRASRCPATWGLCGLCVAVWLIWLCASALPPLRGVGGDFVWARALETLFALSPGAVAQGAVWQGVTYALLHGSWAHLLVNLAGLAVTGSALERVLGARRMVALFTLGAAAGAGGFLASLSVDARLPAGMDCVGASAVLAACIGAVTTLAWRERVVLWVAVLPVRLRAGWLLPLFLAFSVCEAVYWPLFTAYGAHVGGWLAGVLLGVLWRRR